jgi:transcriptional regulator with XRE-family HTH domain
MGNKNTKKDKKYAKLGNRIREIREKLDFTQDEFCLELDVPKRTYLRYESGETQAPLGIIEKIAKLGNITTDYFLEEHNTYNNSVHISGQNFGDNNISINRKDNTSKDLFIFFDLMEKYATPKLIEEFTNKLLKIKEAHGT